jgi:hypothetical protein
MSRTSYRGLALTLVLIIGLGMALPAAARPAERGPATQDGLLAWIWDWVEHLWRGASQPGKDPHAITAASGPCDPDRGAAIDPNGNPCHK